MESSLNVQKLNTLTQKVEYILNHFPHTRNSDIELQAELCARFYPPLEKPIYTWYDFVAVMRSLPTEDHIARARRKVIQTHNYTKYLPTVPEIATARKINEDVWRTYAKQHDLLPPIQRPDYPPEINHKLEQTGMTGIDD